MRSNRASYRLSQTAWDTSSLIDELFGVKCVVSSSYLMQKNLYSLKSQCSDITRPWLWKSRIRISTQNIANLTDCFFFLEQEIRCCEVVILSGGSRFESRISYVKLLWFFEVSRCKWHGLRLFYLTVNVLAHRASKTTKLYRTFYFLLIWSLSNFKFLYGVIVL